jgi:hypothetical protein
VIQELDQYQRVVASSVDKEAFRPYSWKKATLGQGGNLPQVDRFWAWKAVQRRADHKSMRNDAKTNNERLFSGQRLRIKKSELSRFSSKVRTPFVPKRLHQ